MTQATIDSQATCATCPYYAARNDGTDKGWCNLFNYFARESHATTQDCINTIADEQAVAQEELNQDIEAQAQEIAPEPATSIEADSDFDADFGTVYRVWRSYHLLGTFYFVGKNNWVAEPVGFNFRPHFSNPERAQAFIVAANKLQATNLTA